MRLRHLPFDAALIATMGAVLGACSATSSDPAGAQPGDSRLISALGAAGDAEQDPTAVVVEAAAGVADEAEVRAAESLFLRDPNLLPATEIEPELSEQDVQAQFAIAEFVDASDWPGATAALIEFMQDRHGARLDYLLGDLLLRQERLDEAAQAFRNATEAFPNYVNAWRQLGNVLYRLGDYGSAVPAFSKVVALGRSGAGTYGVLGICHAKGGDYLSAESAFRMAMLLEPSSIDWKQGLGESLARQKRFADAAALFGGLLEDNPDSAQLWLAQGEAFARLGKPMQAAQNFEMADRLGGANEGVLYDLGNIYANEGLFGPAIDAYTRAMRKKDDASPDRALRAAEYLAGRGADGAAGFIDAIEGTFANRLEPEQQKQLLKARVRLAFGQGATDEEARLLEQIVSIDPTDGDALLKLGDHARRTENYARAITWFERAAAIDAYKPDALVGHARVLVHERKYEDAIPLLKLAQSLKERAYVEEFLERVQRAARGR